MRCTVLFRKYGLLSTVYENIGIGIWKGKGHFLPCSYFTVGDESDRRGQERRGDVWRGEVRWEDVALDR